MSEHNTSDFFFTTLLHLLSLQRRESGELGRKVGGGKGREREREGGGEGEGGEKRRKREIERECVYVRTHVGVGGEKREREIVCWLLNVPATG